MSESKHLKKLLNEIGSSVHNINTIAVSLSNLSPGTQVADSLNIRWKPVDVTKSAICARRFAVRSAIVFCAEALFEYLSNLSGDPLWIALGNGKNFHEELAANDSKAKRFSEFCKGISGIDREWAILVELLCHWRNRIVHAQSKASISAKDRQILESKAKEINENFYHFDVFKAFNDFEADRVTLKEATTLITFVIKCCRKIDEYYISKLKVLDLPSCEAIISADETFIHLAKQQESLKKNRKLTTYIKINYGLLSQKNIDSLVKKNT